MRGLTRCVLASIAAAGLLAGCATYDYGYGYAQPYYGYSYDYGPYSYDYGPYYYGYGYGPYYYGAPAIGFDFGYRHYDLDGHNHYRHDRDYRHYGAAQHYRYSGNRGSYAAQHNVRAPVTRSNRSGTYARSRATEARPRA